MSKTKKCCIRLLCALLFAGTILIGISACAKSEKPTSSVSASHANGNTSGLPAYWKAVEIMHEESSYIDDFWSDLFLWEGGKGYFRVNQADQNSRYYGIREVINCDWVFDNGELVLTDSRSQSRVIAKGAIKEGRLHIEFTDSLYHDLLTITMENAPLPPYGAQWELPELYGTWRMVSYSDADSGTHTAGKTGGSLVSQITIHPVSGARFWLVNGEYVEMEYALSIGHYEENKNGGSVWFLYNEGPIWKDCKNEAWHVELKGSRDPKIQYYVTYADGRLLLRQDDSTKHSLFTAEYERADNSGGESGHAQGKAAYAEIIGFYKHFAISQSLEAAEYLLSRLTSALSIKNEQQTYELDNSIFESRNGSLGYALFDLNGDGTPELIILSEDYTIHAIYTLQLGKHILVGSYWSRKNCIMDEIGLLCISSSSGAADNSESIYFLDSDGKLRLIEEKADGALKYFQDSYPYNPVESAGLEIISL